MSTPQEIERKFLVADCPSLDGLQKEEVRQGYVSGTADEVEVRVRQKGEGLFLTVKSGGTIQRSEYETPITRAQFDTLWPATEGRRVEKTRYTGQLACGVVFELDVYSGRLAPLRVVEVEFASLESAEAFVPPAWFGDDVSTDKRYKNKRLAVADGMPAP